MKLFRYLGGDQVLQFIFWCLTRVLLFEFIVLLIADIEFDSEVCWRDIVNIPLLVLYVLYILQVSDVVRVNEGYHNAEVGDFHGCVARVLDFLVRELARGLQVHVRVLLEALVFVGVILPLFFFSPLKVRA